MDHQSALDVLKSDEALHKKLSGVQFLVLSLVTIVLPVGILIGIWSTLS